MDRRLRPSLPAALLIFGVALSCSTACVTTAVVLTGAAATGAAVGAIKRKAHESNAPALPPSPVPTVTNDADSLENALMLRLPPLESGATEKTKRLRIEHVHDRDGQPFLAITVIGYFTKETAHEYSEFARQLQRQLPGSPRIMLSVFDNDGDNIQFVARFDLK